MYYKQLCPLLLTLALLCLLGCDPIIPGTFHRYAAQRRGEEPPDAPQHLLFKEIYYTGNIDRLNRYPYDIDTYIILLNPTEQTLYLDGLSLIISSFSSMGIPEFGQKQNLLHAYLNTQQIRQFPGSGHDFPIPPGGTVLLTACAIDHRKARTDPTDPTVETEGNPYSIDLSHADFEWLTPQQMQEEEPAYLLTDNPNIPNMLSYSIHTPKGEQVDRPFSINSKLSLIALVKLEKPLTNLSNEDFWEFYLRGAGRGIGVKIANAQVIDAVNICNNEEYLAPICSASIDAGYVGAIAHRKQPRKHYARKAIMRKHNGLHWVDTNDSSVDFLVIDKGSLFPQ